METRFEKEFAELWNRGRAAWPEAIETGKVWYEHTEGSKEESRCSRIDGLILGRCLVVADKEQNPDGEMRPIDDGTVELDWGAPLPLRWCISRFKIIRCPFRLDMERAKGVRDLAWKDVSEARAWVDEKIPLGGS
jgi:hypothetical protein